MTVPRDRLNLWPYGIIVFFVLFISATVGLVLFATVNNMDLVSDDYYEREVKFQDQLNRIDRAHRLKGTVRVRYDATLNLIELSLPHSEVGHQVTGTIHLYRPSEARLDRKIAIDCDLNGRQMLPTDDLRAGLWKVRLLWTFDQQEYYYDENVLIQGRGTS